MSDGEWKRYDREPRGVDLASRAMWHRCNIAPDRLVTAFVNRGVPAAWSVDNRMTLGL